MLRVNRRRRDGDPGRVRRLEGRLVVALAVVGALGAAGCEGGLRGGGGGPDAGSRVDSLGEVDAGRPGEIDARPDDDRGLVLRFLPKDAIPGDVGGPWDAEITSASLRLTELVVVGDTAIGDSNTQLPAVPLAWGGIEEAVDEARLPLAPAGRYSRVEARIAEVVLEGTLNDGDDPEPFRIEVSTGAGWPFGLSTNIVEVEPGRSTILPIEMDLRELIDAVPWTSVDPDDDGVLVVETGDLWVSNIQSQADDVFDNP